MNWTAADLAKKTSLPKQDVVQAVCAEQETAKQAKFIGHIRQRTGIELTPEYLFHPERKWRMDFACLEHKFYIEIDGGAWTSGRHTRGKGFIEDQKKRNAAVALGWRPIHITPQEMYGEYLIELIEQYLK